MSRFAHVQQVAPKYYYCPLTGELMTDPVQASDGIIYDRYAIEGWLAAGMQHSPSTAEFMPVDQALIPQTQLQMDIQAHLASLGWEAEQEVNETMNTESAGLRKENDSLMFEVVQLRKQLDAVKQQKSDLDSEVENLKALQERVKATEENLLQARLENLKLNQKIDQERSVYSRLSGELQKERQQHQQELEKREAIKVINFVPFKGSEQSASEQVVLQDKLTAACEIGEVKPVSILIEEEGADPKMPDSRGIYPYGAAIRSLNPDLIFYLEPLIPSEAIYCLECMNRNLAVYGHIIPDQIELNTYTYGMMFDDYQNTIYSLFSEWLFKRLNQPKTACFIKSCEQGNHENYITVTRFNENQTDPHLKKHWMFTQASKDELCRKDPHQSNQIKCYNQYRSMMLSHLHRMGIHLMAAYYRQQDLFFYLVDRYQMNLQAGNKTGRNALMLLVSNDSEDYLRNERFAFVKRLVEYYGLNLKAIDHHGQTVLDIARNNNNDLALVEWLEYKMLSSIQTASPQSKFVSKDYSKGPLSAFSLELQEKGKQISAVLALPGNQLISVLSTSPFQNGTSTLAFWDLSTGQCTQEVSAHTGFSRSLHLLPNNRFLVSGNMGGYGRGATSTSMQIWDVRGRKKVFELDSSSEDWPKHLRRFGAVTNVGMLDDRLLMVGLGGHCVIINLVSRQIERSSDRPLQDPTGWRSLVVLPDGLIARGGTDSIELWDQNLAFVRPLASYEGSISHFTLLPNGKVVGVVVSSKNQATNNTSICIWDVNSGRCEQTLGKDNGHASNITNLKVTSEGIIITTAKDNTIRFWEPNSGECIHVMELPYSILDNTLCIHSDGRVSGVAFLDRNHANYNGQKIFVWNFSDLKSEKKQARKQRSRGNHGVFSNRGNAPRASTKTASGSPSSPEAGGL